MEVFYLRDIYKITFDTRTTKITVNDDNAFKKVVFEEPLSNIADKIKTSNNQSFVIDVTNYQDDNLAVKIFKGWFDNPACEGNPVDFSKMTMPDHDLILYAKWEKLKINVTYDANGGKVEGEDEVTKTQESGDVAARPEDPVPPEGMTFYCWAINGMPYDFTEPIVEDCELEAFYYSSIVHLQVTYDPGEGSGTVPVDEHFYLTNANPEVLGPVSGMIPPIGKYFSDWKVGSLHYAPGDEFLITKNTLLVADYANCVDIVIAKSGMNEGESAVFNVKKSGTSDIMFSVLLTGAADGTATATITNLSPGSYTVEEYASWSWAYNETPLEAITKTLTADDHTFEFTNVAKNETPLHSEAIKSNNFAGYALPSVE